MKNIKKYIVWSVVPIMDGLVFYAKARAFKAKAKAKD